MIVRLTRGYSAIIDDEDEAAVIAAGNWSASVKRDGHVYAVTGVKRSDGRWTTTRMHNLVTGWRFVDHINGDGLDNRRENLRESDRQTNAQNARMQSRNTSGRKGVTWHRGARKWAAQITVNKERRHLGLFVDLNAAGAAYDEAAREHFGEFARLNFPNEGEQAA